MIKNIIFDLGGVLIDWNPRAVFRTIFPNEEMVKAFLENICTMEWNIQQDKGRTLADATIMLQQKHPEWHNEIGAYYSRWEEMLIGPIEETVTILKKIHQKGERNLYALTNWSAETFPVALKRYEFLQLFEGIVVSGTEKCIKPDAEIYNVILTRYDLVASECLFIDDNQDNIAAANLLGLKTHYFVTSAGLAEYLKEQGVI